MPSLRKIWLASKIQVCQKGIPAVQRNIQRKNLLEELKLFLFFGLWTRIFMVSGKTKLTDLPELHSMCPEKNFQYLSKKNKFDSILRLWEKNFRSFFATFGHGCQTRILSVQSPSWNKSGIRFIFNFPEFWRKLWFALKYSRFVRKDLTSRRIIFWEKPNFFTWPGKNERLSKYDQQVANALATTEAIRRRLFLFHKNITLDIFSETENVQNFLKFFRQGCENRAHLSKRTFW